MVKRRAAQKSKKATKKNNNSSSCINDNSQHSQSSSSNAAAHTSLLTTGTFCPALSSMDKCHNYSIPCCNALREILAEIVPDVMRSVRAAGEEDVDLLRVDKGERQPSLLSLLVRMHLLEQRRENLSKSVGKLTNDNGSGAGAGGKKKRRKKKKKKGTALEEDRLQELKVDPSSSYASANNSSPMEVEASSVALLSTSRDSAATCQDLSVARKDTLSEPQDKLIRITPEISIDEPHRGNGTIPLESQDDSRSDSKPSRFINRGKPTQLKRNARKTNPLEKQGREQEPQTLDKFNELLDEILSRNPNETKCKDTSNRHSPPPLPPPNRSLPALLQFINASYNKALSAKGSRGSKSSAMPSLPTKELINMCERVQCAQCRNACVHYVSSISQSSSSSVEVAWGGRVQPEEESMQINKRIVLNGASVQTDAEKKNQKDRIDLKNPVSHASQKVDKDVSIDQAFDYMAMGDGVTEVLDDSSQIDMNLKRPASTSREDYLELHVVKDEETKIEYLQLCRDQDVLDMEKGGVEISFPFSLSNVERLILDIIVPCGLYELGPTYESDDEKKPTSQQSDEYTNDDSIFQGFHQHKSNLNRSMYTRIQRLRSTCEAMQNLLILSDEDPTAPVFNARTPKTLADCSKKCEDFVDESYDFLIMLHYTTINTRVNSHEHQKYVQDVISSLWLAYDRMIKGLLVPANTFRW